MMVCGFHDGCWFGGKKIMDGKLRDRVETETWLGSRYTDGNGKSWHLGLRDTALLLTIKI